MNSAPNLESVEPATNAALDALSLELGRLQRAARVAELPIVVVFEGWEGSGKGTIINGLSLALDARGYRVVSILPAKDQEPLYPPLRRFAIQMPEAGRITIFDRSWYKDLWAARARGKVRRRELAAHLEELYAFEQMLVADGVLIVKFFLDITRKEQSRRLAKLQGNRATRWRIDAEDSHQNEHFERWQEAADEVLFATHPEGLDGFLVCDASKKRSVREYVFRILIKAIGDHLARDAARKGSVAETANEDGSQSAPEEVDVRQPVIRIAEGRSPLLDVDLAQRLRREEYEAILPGLQSRLRELEHRIYEERIPVVISSEGWDAAGKGGAIRRLLDGLDPRGYDVHPISAPTTEERLHHYLWRFWTRLPKGGHIAVFDRSWYGRVLVERIEGFCTEAAWRRAFSEIAAFERSLVSYGTVLVKLWFQIDQDTQLGRFREREQSEDKRWKITEEDWRNRARWADYEAAVADMLCLSNAEDCPYTVIPANDKLFARIATLRAVIAAIERAL